ncbi:MAG: hypothetical protein LBT79_01355 [Elusimicrobiota bacterium]|jgi:hypothetical protein|nr:hypothetical protein [Elusimicrobiota bacterium]
MKKDDKIVIAGAEVTPQTHEAIYDLAYRNPSMMEKQAKSIVEIEHKAGKKDFSAENALMWLNEDLLTDADLKRMGKI